MAYGLIINSNTGQEVFNSDTAFGFIEIGSYAVPATGSGGPTNFSPTIVTDDGFSEVFLIYTPEEIRGSDVLGAEGTRRPTFGSSSVTGSGITTWTINYTWNGDAPSSGNNQMNGGKLLIFGR